MKIGISSYSFEKYRAATGCTYIDLCDKAKEIGFDGIEFIDLKVNEGQDVFTLAKEIKEHCDSIGLEISAYTVGANFLGGNPENEVERLKKCIDVCEALGAPTLRHDACWGLKNEYLYTWRDAIKEMAPYIRQVTQYAQDKGIRTCTENHGYVLQAPERVEALILEVNHKNYGWLCDMGNFLCADADPVKSVTVAAPYAFHVHAKDFILKNGGECPQGFFGTTGKNWLRGTILGHGVVPVKQCINILKGAGYDGWVSLEFEGLEDNLTAVKMGYELLKEACK